MYCPQCATPNADGVRFCRACGMELEAVALVLSERSAQPTAISERKSDSGTVQELLEKRSKAVTTIITGTSLLLVSVLIGVAMAFFVPAEIPWILAWAVLVGWMAMMGGMEVAKGIGGVLEAKSRLRMLGMLSKEAAYDALTKQLSFTNQPPTFTNPSTAVRSSPPSSVTEETTRQLDN